MPRQKVVKLLSLLFQSPDFNLVLTGKMTDVFFKLVSQGRRFFRLAPELRFEAFPLLGGLFSRFTKLCFDLDLFFAKGLDLQRQRIVPARKGQKV